MSDDKNIKAEAHRLVDGLPDTASWDDLAYEVYVRQAIDAGLADAAAGRLVDHDVMSAALLWLPKENWLRPWQYIDRVALEVANHWAACSICCLVSPQRAAAIVGVYSRTIFFRASKPSVWAST